MSLTQITKNTAARFAAGAVGIAMAVSGVGAIATHAYAAGLTTSQIQSILSLLASFGADATTINNVQLSLNGQPTSGTGSSSSAGGYSFSKDLTVGSTGADVMNLQKVLNMSADTQVASTGAGSPGNETSTFGPATKAAVIKFQAKNGISPQSGYVGPVTRAKLNSMGGTTTGGTTTTPAPTPSGTGLSVSAGSKPGASLAPAGANRVPFTNIVLTAGNDGDVTVNGITVQRTGLAQDAAFAGVVLVDVSTGLQLDIAKTFNSNHQATIGGTFTIPRGTSKTFLVAGNMASSLSSYVGQVATIDVVGINTSATVSGSLPISGVGQTLNNSLTLGTVTINTSSLDPDSAVSQPIGTTGYRFSAIRFTAGSAEDVTLRSIRWNQIGSASASDLANIVTVVDSTSYPTTIDSTGKYYSTVFPAGIVIGKGNSVDVYVKGDVVGSGAAGRIAEFDIYKNTDVYFTGNTYGYGITATGSFDTISTASTHDAAADFSGSSAYQGSTFSITAGSVTTLAKANEVPAQNIAVNVANQTLGGFATNFSGEPVSVQSMYFAISTTSGSLPTTAASPYSAITSVSLVDENGSVVAGPVDASLADGTTAHGGTISAASSYAWIHFTDTVTFPVGRHVYTLKGKLPSAWANNGVVVMYTKPSSDWTSVTGQTTGNTISLSAQTTVIAMNQMTVKAAALTSSLSAQPTSQNVVVGTQGLTLANYKLDATASGEDLRFSSFPVTITLGGSGGAVGDLTGCQLYDGTTALNTGSNVVNTWTDATAKTYSLDSAYTVAKGTIATLTLKCNLSAAAGGSATYTVNNDTTATDYSITGVVSGNSVTPTLTTGNGGTMSVATGSFTLAVDASSPNYAIAAGGATGVNIGVLRLRATNEAVNLTKIGLNLATGTAGSLNTVSIYDGSTLMGTVDFSSGTTATSTLSSVVSLAKGVDKTLTLKADLASIGTGQSGVQGALVKINPVSAEGTGVSSGTTIQVGSTDTVNGVRTFKSYPTVALGSLSSTGIADGKLMRFTVTANAAGSIGLYQVKFTIATSSFVAGGGVYNFKLYAYNDSSYSSAVSTPAGGGQVGSTMYATRAGDLVASPTVTFQASTTNALQIPAGTTYYFEMVGTVTGTQTGTSISTTLSGDSAYPTVSNGLGGQLNNASFNQFMSSSTGLTSGNGTHAFVWSGNATSSPSTFAANDWTNGYGVVGLPSGGLTQTRSN